MHDASAKIPSGLINGNLNQYGDFDQCLNVISPQEDNFHGKYCLSYIQIAVPPNNLPRLKYIRRLIQSHDAFVNDFHDVGFHIFIQKSRKKNNNNIPHMHTNLFLNVEY